MTRHGGSTPPPAGICFSGTAAAAAPRRGAPPPRRRAAAAAAAAAEYAPSADAAAAAARVPTRLNTIPHPRETRAHFYADAAAAAAAAVAAGGARLTLRCTIPELNPEFDVYRVGTLLELAREVATALAEPGAGPGGAPRRRVRVCVQQPLGAGVFQGSPLMLSGVRRIMERMDWGAAAQAVSFGAVGAAEVAGDVDAFVLLAPQNVTGHSILPFLEEMTAAAAGGEGGGGGGAAAAKPMLLLNPRLADIQSAGGVMSVRGRQARLDFLGTYAPAYHFRLLYRGAAMFPIVGALRHAHGGRWAVLQRADLGGGAEEWRPVGEYGAEPTPAEITECFQRAYRAGYGGG